MKSRAPNPEEQENERPPARSGTPTAWTALALLAILMAGWIFFDTLVCGFLRAGLSAASWLRGDRLSIQSLTMEGRGRFLARGVEGSFGPSEHRSHCKSEWIEVRLASPTKLFTDIWNHPCRPVSQIHMGKTRLLIDTRRTLAGQGGAATTAAPLPSLPWRNLLPSGCSAWPVDLVVIGDGYRLAIDALGVRLPSRWQGGVFYKGMVLDIGSWHRGFSAATADATWDEETLQLRNLALGKELQLQEVALTPREAVLEFGWAGTLGRGRLRGDGALGSPGSPDHLEGTLVGENLSLESLYDPMDGQGQRAVGIIRQARFTFRGNPARPLEADSSLRLVADGFRWQGRGWESLRCSATLIGRNLTVSELRLRQRENEVVAEGQSKLPEDWRNVLRAPFAATFRASLQDAGALAALGGPGFAQLSGGLELEGRLKGAENKAWGYCTLLGTGMKFRNLPFEWLKGCVLFEGEKTRVGYLEGWSGDDRLTLEGTVENSRPHAYEGTAQLGVKDLTDNLARLGITTAPVFGGGSLRGSWEGRGSMTGHSGTFQARVNDWISPLTKAGISGSFEGSYSPGHLLLSKAEFRQKDLRLGLQLSASPKLLEATSLTALRKGDTKPLLEGSFSLPVNAPELWRTGDLPGTIGMSEPVLLKLGLHGIKAEELADLLGQQSPFTGVLEGEISAGGTPEKPFIRGSLHATQVTLGHSADTADFSLRLDAAEGRADISLIQEPAATPPLSIGIELPFRWSREGGKLRCAATTEPMKGQALFRHAPLDGWVGLAGFTEWPLRSSELDGSLTLEGTPGKPTLHGNVRLGAGEAAFPGAGELLHLSLPVAFEGTRALCTGGTVFQGDRPLALTGSLDWSGDAKGSIEMSGVDLALPPCEGFETRGDVDLRLFNDANGTLVLGGGMIITTIKGPVTPSLTPFFTPPGCTFHRNNPPQSIVPPPGRRISLDLTVKSGGAIPVTAHPEAKGTSSPPTAEAEFRLTGTTEEPRAAGKITARNLTLTLPAGSFLLPEVTVLLDPKDGGKVSATAFGLTRSGLCAVGIDGFPGECALRFDGPPGMQAAQMVLELAQPRKPGGPETGIICQLPAWSRQETLFPLPATGWITSLLGKGEGEAGLGFYGPPWSSRITWEPAAPFDTKQ